MKPSIRFPLQVFLILSALLIVTLPIDAKQFLTIKYRATQVDVDHSNFEFLDTSQSSFVDGAWYDFSNEYLIINLNGTNYQYCEVPESTWRQFKDFNSHGSYGKAYNRLLKGRYDCRVNRMPSY